MNDPTIESKTFRMIYLNIVRAFENFMFIHLKKERLKSINWALSDLSLLHNVVDRHHATFIHLINYSCFFFVS